MTADAFRISLGDLREGTVVDRPNRFVAIVLLDGKEVRCHVADSGRLKELIFPGNRVMVRDVGEGRERAGAGKAMPPRKTSFDLVLAAAPPSCGSRGRAMEAPCSERFERGRADRGGTTWVSVDTRYPTKLFGQVLRARGVPDFAEYDVVRAEYSLRGYERKDGDTSATGSPDEGSAGEGLVDGKKPGAQAPEADRVRKEPTSRFDFYLEGPGVAPALVEVKSVTLCVNGKGLFPDAPTVRGARHVRELAGAVSAGYRAYVVFIAQRDDIQTVSPNPRTDPKFAAALAEATGAGVRLLAYRCKVTPKEIVFDPTLLPVIL